MPPPSGGDARDCPAAAAAYTGSTPDARHVPPASVLALNSGSSTVKYAVYDAASPSKPPLEVTVERGARSSTR
jgi:hypothetical protein